MHARDLLHTSRPNYRIIINIITILFCECKWRSVPSGLQQLEVLRNRARLLHPETSHYMLFSKSGFDEHVAARAAQDGTVTLVDFADMD